MSALRTVQIPSADRKGTQYVARAALDDTGIIALPCASPASVSVSNARCQKSNIGSILLQCTFISADDVSIVWVPNGRYFGNWRCDCSPVCQEPLLPKPRYSPTLTIEERRRHSSVEARHTVFVVELMTLTQVTVPGPAQTPSASLN